VGRARAERSGRRDDATGWPGSKGPPPLAAQLFGLLFSSTIAVVSLGEAWSISSKPASVCRTVDFARRSPQRYRCVPDLDPVLVRPGLEPSGGMSQQSATLLLVVSGLVMLALALYAGASILGSLRWERERRYDDSGIGDLIDDLAELDDLHDQGLLTHDELVAAKRRRRRQLD
jgi:hypothetical protein